MPLLRLFADFSVTAVVENVLLGKAGIVAVARRIVLLYFLGRVKRFGAARLEYPGIDGIRGGAAKTEQHYTAGDLWSYSFDARKSL